MNPTTVFIVFSALFFGVCVALPSPADQAPLKRERRDACSDLLQETGEEPYVTCFNYLSRMGPENPGAEPEAVEGYCSAKCDETLNTFFDQIDVVCNPGGGGGGNVAYDSAIQALCHIDPRGYHCGIDYITLLNYTIQDATYTSCVDSYYGGGGKDGSCTDDCAAATDYIINTFGCCYTKIQVLEITWGLKKDMIDSAVFKSCGGKNEPQC